MDENRLNVVTKSQKVSKHVIFWIEAKKKCFNLEHFRFSQATARAQTEKIDLSLIQWHNLSHVYCFTFFSIHFHWAYGFCSTFLLHITHVFNWSFAFAIYRKARITKCQFLWFNFADDLKNVFPFYSRAFVCDELRNENWKYLRGFDCLHVFTPNCPFA